MGVFPDSTKMTKMERHYWGIFPDSTQNDQNGGIFGGCFPGFYPKWPNGGNVGGRGYIIVLKKNGRSKSSTASSQRAKTP